MENSSMDSRFTQLEEEKQAALQKTDTLYGDLIDETVQTYQTLQDGASDYEQQQIRQQNQQMEADIGQIRQQQEQAQKDYTKEQSAAYTDFQKQEASHGVNAETMASGGMTGSGYSESAKVSMYNTYQSRVSAARESYQLAVRDYENAIQEARRLNSSALAQIAYDAFQTRMKLSLEGSERTGQLKLDWADKTEDIRDLYYDRKQDVQEQINIENELAEEKRQFDLTNSGKLKDYEEKLKGYEEKMKAYEEKDKANQAELEAAKQLLSQYQGLEKQVQAYAQREQAFIQQIQQLQDRLTALSTQQAQPAAPLTPATPAAPVTPVTPVTPATPAVTPQPVGGDTGVKPGGKNAVAGNQNRLIQRGW